MWNDPILIHVYLVGRSHPVSVQSDMENMMQGQGSSGSGQSSSATNYDPQQIVAWSRNAKPNDLIEVGKSIFSRVGDLSPTDQKMFFDQLNREPTISKLLTQYTHA